MSRLAILLLTVAALGADDKKPEAAPPPAQIVVTADLACLHCTFGEGESCAVCLKLDDKTPLMLGGKVAKQFVEERLSKKTIVAEGVVALDKDKRLVLTGEKGRLLTDADKGKVPAKGEVRVLGDACCGRCDLGLCDECALAIRNGSRPLVLDGKLAAQHAESGKEAQTVTATGRLFLDKRGLLRLEATKVELKKK